MVPAQAPFKVVTKFITGPFLTRRNTHYIEFISPDDRLLIYKVIHHFTEIIHK